MCQENSKRTHSKTVKCYRVYELLLSGLITSYYEGKRLPKLGVPTRAFAGPFHAFRSRAAILHWFNYTTLHQDWTKFVVYECELSGNVKSGRWGDTTKCTTYTGETLTIRKKVATGNFFKGTLELVWTA